MTGAKKFGAFGGVFSPSILTILGVIMYMRLGWIVGNAGLYGTIVLLIIAHVISVSTGLSISSIATDKKVGAGGVYYVLSRSLGLPIGGTIGVALLVATALSIALYLVGFAESFNNYLGLDTSINGLRITGTVSLILLGIIALVYFILKKIFLPVFITENNRVRWSGNIQLSEKIFWGVFIAFMAVSLLLSHAIVGLTLVLFIGGIMWRSINNYLLGLVFQTGNKYKIGQIIRHQNTQGTIRAFNNRSLELELEGGEFLDIPYRHFAKGPIFRPSSKSGIMSHPIDLVIPKPCHLEQEEISIRRRLLSLPWILPNQKIVFEHLSDEPQHYKIRVTLYGIDLSHLYKAEQAVKRVHKRVIQ